MGVHPDKADHYNLSLPPDSLWLRFSTKGASGPVANKTYSYIFRGEIVDLEENEIDLKVLPIDVYSLVLIFRYVDNIPSKLNYFKAHTLSTLKKFY